MKLEMRLWLDWLRRASDVAVIALIVLLTGCGTSVSVRAPSCDPPPVQPELLLPCFPDDDPLILPANDSMYEVYRSYVANMTGPVQRCVRKDDQLIAVIKDRAAFCSKLKADAEKASKRWWEF